MLSISRICISPAIYFAIKTERSHLALCIVLYTLLSDGLDGFLARAMGVNDGMGVLLDPLGDKCFLIGMYMGIASRVEYRWVCYALSLREAVAIFGGALMYLSGCPISAFKPIMLGKISFVVNILVGFTYLMQGDILLCMYFGLLMSYSSLIFYTTRAIIALTDCQR